MHQRNLYAYVERANFHHKTTQFIFYITFIIFFIKFIFIYIITFSVYFKCEVDEKNIFDPKKKKNFLAPIENVGLISLIGRIP